MRILLIFVSFIFWITVNGQYPFEKYSAIQYREFKNWKFPFDIKENTAHCILTIPDFYSSRDSLTIQIIPIEMFETFPTNTEHKSYIKIYRNQTLVQRIFEPMWFNDLNINTESVGVADINGDKLDDIKMVVSYMGNGIASMNVRKIYLFQNSDSSFTKISFDDKGGGLTERDVDGDGDFEIITRTLQAYMEHNYWLFNLFEYNNKKLISANSKANYPIMIQFLYRENYAITDKISRDEMKEFAMPLPQGYDER